MTQFKVYIVILMLVSSTLRAQSLTRDELKFIARNASAICKDENFSSADWRPLAAPMKNKRIILLGEFNHGSKEIFLLRNSLIKYLHKEMGVNTILLESGIGEVITADMNKSVMTGAQMTNGLFGGWRTKEFSELMDYVKSENLSIAGFDAQRTGGSFAFLLKDIAIKNAIDSSLYANLENRYTLANRELTNRKVIYDSVKKSTEKLIFDYRLLHDELSQHKTNNSSKELLLSMMTLQSRVKYLSYMLAFAKDGGWNNRWAARDSAMADNIQWLITHVYKNEPVIVIGHNFHIARYNEKERVMGEILSSRYDKEMYSIGIFAGSGSFLDNSGKEQHLLPPDSTRLDIKHVIAKLQPRATYINITTNKEPGRDWLDNKIIVNDTFIDLSTSNTMILSKHFDGLLFIDEVSPPDINK